MGPIVNHHLLAWCGLRIVAAACVVQALVSSASACDCPPVPKTVEQFLQSANVVFIGVATRSVPTASYNGVFDRVTTFRVVEAFKGVRAGQTLRVRHNRYENANCGLDYVRGEVYPVAAGHPSNDARTLLTSTCDFASFPARGPGPIMQRLREGGPLRLQ